MVYNYIANNERNRPFLSFPIDSGIRQTKVSVEQLYLVDTNCISLSFFFLSAICFGCSRPALATFCGQRKPVHWNQMKDQKRNQKHPDYTPIPERENGKISSFTSTQTETQTRVASILFCSFTDDSSARVSVSCPLVPPSVCPPVRQSVRPFALHRVTCFTVEWPSIVLDSLWTLAWSGLVESVRRLTIFCRHHPSL